MPPLCPKLERVEPKIQNKIKSLHNCTVCDAPDSDNECDPIILGKLLGENIEDKVILCEACHGLVALWEAAKKDMDRAEAEARVQRRLGFDKKEGEVLIGKLYKKLTVYL